jgi:hypothetical protein
MNQAINAVAQRQQKGRRRGVGPGQSGHQQDGTGDPAGADRGCQPRHVLALKGLPGRRQYRAAELTQDRHPNARAAVKQPGEYDRINRANDDLGGRCRDAKQGSGGEGVEDCGPVHAAILKQKRSGQTRQRQAKA